MAETPLDRKQLREMAERALAEDARGDRFSAATVVQLLDALDEAEKDTMKLDKLDKGRLSERFEGEVSLVFVGITYDDMGPDTLFGRHPARLLASVLPD